jgi:MFS family permease
MTRIIATATVDADELETVLRPRHGVVTERPLGRGRFEAAAGPFAEYRRVVRVEHLSDGRARVTQTTRFRIAVPFFGWLFVLPLRRALRRPDPAHGRQPWWAPPDQLDPRGAAVLGVLAGASLVTGYLGTLLSQTITFAAGEFGAGSGEQGLALAAARVSVILALVLVAAADRRGRRALLVLCAVGGCLVTPLGALAPSLAWLSGSQMLARGFSIALGVIIGIIAAEEMPAGSRAYAVSVLTMAAALGGGLCVMALPLADLGTSAWRLLYVLPLLGLVPARTIARQLPESRRYGLPHAKASLRSHRGRLLLLAASALLLTVFTSPASQFQNEYLRVERDFTAARIALFTVLTNTPGAIGIVIGGRLADTRGRRLVGAVAVVGGVGTTVLMYHAAGWPLWAWSVTGAIVGAASVPALGVYGPELFPTSLRGAANGVITVVGVAGSVIGLIAAGMLADRFGSLGPAMTVLALGPLLLGVLIIVAYPETAHLELEDLNPEDRPPPSTMPPPGAL